MGKNRVKKGILRVKTPGKLPENCEKNPKK